jgi:hypothetical protein
METLRFERMEYKYMVPESLADEIRQFIAPYVAADENTAVSPESQYPVTNLYFDTPNLAFYWAHRHQAVDRFKLRLRTYGTGGRAPGAQAHAHLPALDGRPGADVRPPAPRVLQVPHGHEPFP